MFHTYDPPPTIIVVHTFLTLTLRGTIADSPKSVSLIAECSVLSSHIKFSGLMSLRCMGWTQRGAGLLSR